MKKLNHEIFPKIWKFLCQIIFKAKFFFFLEKDIFKFHLQILENPKNFMISFFIPLGLNGVVGNEIWQASSFSHPQRFVRKKVRFKTNLSIFRKETFHDPLHFSRSLFHVLICSG